MSCSWASWGGTLFQGGSAQGREHPLLATPELRPGRCEACASNLKSRTPLSSVSQEGHSSSPGASPQHHSLDFPWGRYHSHLCPGLSIPEAGPLALPAADPRLDHNLLLLLKREACSLCPSGRFCMKFFLAVAFPHGCIKNKSKQGREEHFSKLRHHVIFYVILQLLIAKNILVWIFD